MHWYAPDRYLMRLNPVRILNQPEPSQEPDACQEPEPDDLIPEPDTSLRPVGSTWIPGRSWARQLCQEFLPGSGDIYYIRG